MRKTLIKLILCLLPFFLNGQRVSNPLFEKKLDALLKHDVPEISLKEILSSTIELIFLDARELEEYEVSHIPGAIHVGFDDFDTYNSRTLERSANYVVYCSVGYRSEIVARKLISKGYPHVYNFYGSIFEWANEGNRLVDKRNLSTSKLHTYNKNWSKWINNVRIQKIW